jgi:cell division protein FtsI (penicillin-binding protein 3)
MIDQGLKLRLPSTSGAAPARIELQGTRSSSLVQAYGRVVLVSLAFTVLYLIILIRAFDLMVMQGVLLRDDESLAAGHKLTSVVSMPRADIVDRNGILLATSIKMASLYADPHVMIDAVGAAKGLAAIFPDQSYGELLQKLQSEKRFVWIHRNLTPEEQAAVLELGQPGLAFQEEYKRLYPHGALASHIVGYSGIDGQGLSGVEQGFNNILKNNGTSLGLTLDVRLQYILHRELQQAMSDFHAPAGNALIMDIKNGDVLGAVSLPDFDPHQPNLATDTEKFNRNTLGTYELGSTFKIFTTAAFLEQKKGTLASKFDTTQPLKIGRFTINDFHPEKHALTVPEIFMYSSNIGTAMMAQTIGTEGLKSFFDQLGFFKPMRFDLPEVASPQVPTPWREISTLTTSYGHGIAITPLHMAAATATIAGNGTLVQPRLILNDTQRPSGRAINAKAERVISMDTVDEMRDLLRLVVRHGTGANADVPGLLVGGKTGTSEKNIGGRYIHNKLLSSFVGVFPIDKPKYVIVLSVDEPKPNAHSFGYATAGWTAAPAVGRVVTKMAAVLGIAPRDIENDPADTLTKYLAEFHEKPKTTTNPTLTGATPVAAVVSIPD